MGLSVEFFGNLTILAAQPRQLKGFLRETPGYATAQFWNGYPQQLTRAGPGADLPSRKRSLGFDSKNVRHPVRGARLEKDIVYFLGMHFCHLSGLQKETAIKRTELVVRTMQRQPLQSFVKLFLYGKIKIQSSLFRTLTLNATLVYTNILK